MKYVYLLQSLSHPAEFYTGITTNFTERLVVGKAHIGPRKGVIYSCVTSHDA